MSATDERPRPEHFLGLIRRQQRGRLKVYLGFAPGVGKTFEMLQEGQRLQKQGVDVVIGVVETHGRTETIAQIGTLPQLPRRRIEYRGVTLEELDLEALLARRPTVALIDELAHTNAPGSRNAKRYQDVEQLLRAGIHVITTMNIQHLESLYDLIEQFTQVKVKERVPDYVLAQADQIVNVDVPAEDLQDRLRGGKVYPMERVERALSHFFTADNLTRLRELALEEIANTLDRQRQKYGTSAQHGSERVMVGLSSRSPNAHRLLRKTARLADRLNAPWYAVYVQTPQERSDRIDAATQRQVSESLALATQLGGISLPFNGPSFEAAVSAFVTEYRITHIVMGRTRRPWYQRWFGQTALDRLLQVLPGVDITLIDVRDRRDTEQDGMPPDPRSAGDP
ncbi:universal stress protein [Tuwongella immobilis]|uniref:Signal transduction histidine kinase osmosensitive K+ channel sensor N-terminal domain-containing protein n=1 Tax=Tuwongella immobilis TaxID=692036 RepID=A0A6C2YTL4_9BACT|nr:universal stress protein [Tuwongella immobilis]VIP04255.1 histidine kinase : Osmosensitive K+ channel His kinase sensor OS=Singulisphaera acidiphila (strain ATCC BAA-1392 / DSM 18658 / VKM B-2454 / MOB10) GN=Sinac_5539 PE=4 SV=1: KdpD: Usp [Tuwongella immobilis]VTS05873.1 histidine kinase : Osmosensitive K+ channel His kinase sensor OS=Singulisphaera acidiphila (strain ATCC BAA-1392 / DSM 18658 / VKM B-2454 / MOB10) GN=Sinac_5539 PE=4 SV=1: KdpD: Usp [Tuwongella immobilis]